MKTKNLPYIFIRILGLLLWIPLLLGTTVRAQEPALPASAADNMVLRLDATTLNLNEGDAVTEWADQSGLENDAAIALDNAPTYKTTLFLTGKPSVNFSGSGQYLEIPHTSDLNLTQLTMFVVFQNSSNVPDDFGVITSKELGSSPWNNRNWWLAVQRQNGELWFRTSSGGQQPRNDLQHKTYNYKDNEPHLVSITVPGSGNGTSTMIVDGLQKANTLSHTPNVQTAPVRIGAAGSTTVNRFFQGDIGEIIIYNRALSSEERQAVEIFLGKKWIGLYADEYFVISATAGVGGIIVPVGDIEVPGGGGTTFNITPNAPHYEIADVKVDNLSVGPVTSYTFTDVQDDHTIDAYFSHVDPNIVITVSAGPNGSIEPSENILKYPGEYQTFTFKPVGDYGVANVLINNEPQGPMSSYTFSNLLENQTIHVEFAHTGPMVHLDADAIVGSHGDAITTWFDKSDYDNNATQSNPNNQPLLITQDGLNGRQVVRFDGTNDVLIVANKYSLDMDQITMFAVYRSTYRESYPSGSIGVLTAKSRGWTNRSWWLVVNNNFSAGGTEAGIEPGALWFRTSSGGSIANTLFHNGDYNNGNAYMVSVVVPPIANNETSKLYIDGGDPIYETGSATIDHAENQIMRIGAGTTSGGGVERWFEGDIAEIIIYNRALSDTERQVVEQMLQAKWFGPQIPEITKWPTASDITYGQAISESNLTGGEASVPGEFSFKYPDVVPDASGPYTAAVVFTPDDTDQWEIVEGTVEITVNKAEATIVVNGYEGTYDGQAYGATLVSADGVNDEDLAEFVTVGIETFTNVDGGEVAWSFEHNNYVSQSGAVVITITKAEATIEVAGYEGVYDGQAYGATLVSAVGVNDEDLEEFVTVGTETFTNVDGGTVAWSFEHNNYEAQSGTVDIIITKANATIVVEGTTVTYDGQPHGATGSSTGVEGDLLAGLDLGLTFTNVPGGTANWTFTDVTGNYNDDNGSVEIEIEKANADILVEGKTVTFDGNAHGASGTAKDVNGDLLAGLDLGLTFTNVPGGTANWTFTDVTGNYNDDNGSVEIEIEKADADILVEGKTVTFDGNAHGASGTAKDVNGYLLAGLSLGAKFTNVPGGTANWVFTDETGNYNNDSGEVAIVINKADATIDVQGVIVTYDGAEHGATGTATGVDGEELAGLDLGDSFTNVPGGTANWIFTDETGNYNDDAGSVAIVINKADATIAVSGTTVTYDGAEHGATGTATGVDGEELAGLDLGAAFTNVPGGTANWTFTDVTGNYNDASGSVEIVITEKQLTITAHNKSRQYSDPNPSWTVSYAGFVLGEDENVLDGALTFTGAGSGSDHNTGPGEYTITPGGLTSDNYTIQFVDGTLTITKEDAHITYIGTRLMAVKAGSTATLDLRVVIEDDEDEYPGNIINADVTFLISWEGGSQTVSTPITTADLVNNQKAVVNVPFDVTLLNGETSRTVNILIQAGGYYFGEEEVVAVVYTPAGDHITGGGFIIPDAGSAGVYPSAPGTHANFGFNFRYHPRTGELQGQANLVIRGESGPPVQFKSNEALAMGINNSGDFPTAQFTVRGDLKQGNTVLASNVLMYATLTDRGNPGTLDDIGFTIWEGNSLLYSSDWKGNYTERMNLSGGNLVIHRGGTNAGDDFEILTDPVGLDAEGHSFREQIGLRVYPNPFRQMLTLGLTPVEDDHAIIQLFDMSGSLVSTLYEGEVTAGLNYTFEYIPNQRVSALLFYRIIIGDKVVNGKLIQRQ